MQIHVGEHFEVDAAGGLHGVGTQEDEERDDEDEGEEPSDKVDKAQGQMTTGQADERTGVDFPSHRETIEKTP